MRLLLGLGLIAIAVFTGCGDTEVTRTSPNAVRELSGRWNATDARVTAEAMVDDVLSRPWGDDFRVKNNGKLPVVKVDRVVANIPEPIDTKIITNVIEEHLNNSGKAEIVSSSDETMAAREERKDQAANASQETAKEGHQETGCDYQLTGEILSQNDQAGDQKQVCYQIKMQLVDVKTQKKVWIKTQPIAKDVKRGDYK
jgi:penicillin-binding protein activator